MLLQYDFQQPVSDWIILIGTHISVAVQFTFIANSAAFQPRFSNFLVKK